MLRFIVLLVFTCCALLVNAQNVATDGSSEQDRPKVTNGGTIDDKMKPVQTTVPAIGTHNVAVQGTIGEDKMTPVQSTATGANRSQENTTITNIHDGAFDKNKPSTRIKP